MTAGMRWYHKVIYWTVVLVLLVVFTVLLGIVSIAGLVYGVVVCVPIWILLRIQHRPFPLYPEVERDTKSFANWLWPNPPKFLAWMPILVALWFLACVSLSLQFERVKPRSAT